MRGRSNLVERTDPPSWPKRAGAGRKRFAAWWLRLKGWRILAQRARVPGGEVDLVARRGSTVAFVEVKQRGSDAAAPGRSTNIDCAG